MSQKPTDYGVDGGELFDLGQGKLWFGFVVRSIRRHLRLFLATFLILSTLGVLLALSGSRQYYAGATVLAARRDSTIGTITNPTNGGSDPTNETPAQAAEQLIKSDASLTRLVEDLKLVERANVGEPALGKMKRGLMESIFSKPDPATQKRDMIDQLRAALAVSTNDRESVKKSVEVSVIWQDPLIAKQIVDAAGSNFIRDTQEREVELITKARDIARAQLSAQQEEVADLRDELGIPVFDERPVPESSPLRGALNRVDDYAQRVLDAETQLKAAEASFPSRFGVTTPAQLPAGSLNGGLMSLLIPILGGAIVGAFVTTLADALRGRVVEPWQVTRGTGLPLLADLKN